MRRRGFTMIELLVVILVIAILITIVAGSYGWLVGRAKKTSTESFLNVIVTGLQNYSEKEGSIPMADWRNDELSLIPHLTLPTN